ncbi:hypothetical protein JW964_09330 [candidate division KSB1 bacterium]|nr:hypothetical protein [candidate division KSB1 bacterium]
MFRFPKSLGTGASACISTKKSGIVEHVLASSLKIPGSWCKHLHQSKKVRDSRALAHASSLKIPGSWCKRLHQSQKVRDRQAGTSFISQNPWELVQALALV